MSAFAATAPAGFGYSAAELGEVGAVGTTALTVAGVLAVGAALFLPRQVAHDWAYGKDTTHVGPAVDSIAKAIEDPKLRSDPKIQQTLGRFAGPESQILQQTAQINAGTAANSRFPDTDRGKALNEARTGAWRSIWQSVSNLGTEDQMLLKSHLDERIHDIQSQPATTPLKLESPNTKPAAAVVAHVAPFSTSVPFSAVSIHGPINEATSHALETPAVLSGVPFSAVGTHGSINDAPSHVPETPAVFFGTSFSAAGIHGSINEATPHVPEAPAVLSGVPFSAAGIHGSINEATPHVPEAPAVLSGTPFSAVGIHGSINDATPVRPTASPPPTAAPTHTALPPAPAQTTVAESHVPTVTGTPPVAAAAPPLPVVGAVTTGSAGTSAVAQVATNPVSPAQPVSPVPPPPPPLPASGTDAGHGIHFDFDSAKLDADAMARIRERALEIKKSGFHHGNGHHLRVEGDTDAVGSQTYNIALSRRRASGVAAALVAELKRDRVNVTASDVEIVAAGKSNLTVQTESENRENRRASITVADGNTPAAAGNGKISPVGKGGKPVAAGKVTLSSNTV